MTVPLTLHIRREGENRYLARVFDGRRMAGSPTIHPRLVDAIGAYGSHAEGCVPLDAFDLWYGGWSVGTVSTTQMRTHAPELADRLEMLSAVMR